MKEIKHTYLITDRKELTDLFGETAMTGFLLETEDGRLYGHFSTDPIQPFAEVKMPPKTTK